MSVSSIATTPISVESKTGDVDRGNTETSADVTVFVQTGALA